MSLSKYLGAIALILITSTASAETLSIQGGLTAEQKATLVLQAAQLATKNDIQLTEPAIPTISQAKEWAGLISAVGDGLVAVANKTGMAVNEFSNSKVGTFTMILLAWNYMGADLIGLMFSIIWFITMVPLWVYCYRRMFLIEEITTYDKALSVDGKKKHIVYSNGEDISDGTTFMYWFTLIIIFVIGIIAAN